jgi:hypothetical protein
VGFIIATNKQNSNAARGALGQIRMSLDIRSASRLSSAWWGSSPSLST